MFPLHFHVNFILLLQQTQLCTKVWVLSWTCVCPVEPIPQEGWRAPSCKAVSVSNPSPCRGNWGRSHMTGHFESLRSCSSPAAAPAPASGRRNGSSGPHCKRRLQPGYLDAGCWPAPQTAAGRGCGWGEDAGASRYSSGRGGTETGELGGREKRVMWKREL